MPIKPPKRKKPHNKILALTTISFQMGVTIYLGAYLGDYLETTYTRSVGYIMTYAKTICVMLSVFISIYMLIKQTKKLNND